MYTGQPPRALAAAISAGLTALVFAVLVYGLGVARIAPAVPAMVSIALGDPPAPPPPPPPPKEKPAVRKTTKAAPKADAGQRNLRNVATPIVAPPVVPLVLPPPVVAAPVANVGSGPQTGASDRIGPGQGAGTRGNGLGGGGTGGDGDGSGGGEPVQGPRRTAGRMAFGDLPDGILPLGAEAPVVVIYAVLPDGTADRCRIERSSGYAAIDDLTCRLIEQRFRFRPALDRTGRPVRSLIRETHTWYARDR